MRMTLACLVATVALAAPTAAEAQCALGREISPDTAGRCCWPAQRWNAEAGRCEGPPRCPEGWVAEGDACLREAPPVAPEVAAPPSRVEALGAPPSQAAPRPYVGLSEEPPPRLQPGDLDSHPDYGFIAAGSVVLALAYIPSAVMGSIFGSWIAGAPVIGAWLWPTMEVFSGLIIGLPLAAVQTVGFILLLVGLASWSENVPWASQPIELIGGPGDIGAGVRVRF